MSEQEELLQALRAARAEIVWTHSCLWRAAIKKGPDWVQINGHVFGLKPGQDRLARIDALLAAQPPSENPAPPSGSKG